jgi:hypothetical protein
MQPMKHSLSLSQTKADPSIAGARLSELLGLAGSICEISAPDNNFKHIHKGKLALTCDTGPGAPAFRQAFGLTLLWPLLVLFLLSPPAREQKNRVASFNVINRATD